MAETRYVIWFEEYSPEQRAMVGGKAAGLSEMSRAGLRVPPGFAVSSAAYHRCLEAAGARGELLSLVERVAPGDIEAARVASVAIRAAIESTSIPADVEAGVRAAYEALTKRCGVDPLPVAVRSSATAEDLAGASFAGQQDTYLWVVGPHRVAEHVRRCWASLYTPEAILYRQRMGISQSDVAMAVVVQKMVRPRTAGVMFTINPLNGDPSKVVINASWGLGHAVVSGEVTPDEFWVDKVTLEILQRSTPPKAVEYVVDHETNAVLQREVPVHRQEIPSLADGEVVELARLGKAVEIQYGRPMDIEWAIDEDLGCPQGLMVLQCRPETIWSQRAPQPLLRPGASPLEHIVQTLVTGRRIRGG